MISVTKKTKILTNNVLSGRFGKYSFVKNIQKVSKSKDFPVLSFYRSKILVGQNKNNLVVSEKFWTGRNILNSTKNDLTSNTLKTIEINIIDDFDLKTEPFKKGTFIFNQSLDIQTFHTQLKNLGCILSI